MVSRVTYASSLALITVRAAVVLAQTTSPLNVAIVTEQFKGALLVPQVFPTFEPSGTLAVNFTQSVGVVATGQAIAIGDVQAKPEFSINLVEVGRALQYTVLIVDASIAGTTNSSSLYRHYLQNDLVRDTPTSGLLFNSSAAITDYTPPAPPAGSGPHRYVALCLQQPTNFTPPAELSISGTGFGAFDPNEYISSTGLQLLAAQYFTVEVGTANVSVAQTSAVNTAPVTPTSLTAGSTGVVGTTTAATSAGERTVARIGAGLALSLLVMMAVV